VRHCACNPHLSTSRVSLSDSIGKYLSVFDSGIRIYVPPTISKLTTTSPYIIHETRVSRLIQIESTILLSQTHLQIPLKAHLNRRQYRLLSKLRSANATLKLNKLQVAQDSTEYNPLRSQLLASESARMAAEAQAREALDLAMQEESARKEADDERNQVKREPLSWRLEYALWKLGWVSQPRLLFPCLML